MLVSSIGGYYIAISNYKVSTALKCQTLQSAHLKLGYDYIFVLMLNSEIAGSLKG